MSAFTVFRSRALFFGVAIVLVCLGNGCLRANAPTVPVDPLAGIRATMGDSLVISQAVADKGKAVPVKRQVTIRQLIPRQTADLDWRMTIGAGTATSTVVMGKVAETVLSTSHVLSLPGSWRGDRHLVHERAALWLGDDEYQELAATKQTTLDPDLRSPEWAEFINQIPEAKRAMAALSQLALEAGQKTDTTVVKQEGEGKQLTLRVNGTDRAVPVRIVRNWYGTFTILDYRDNPLILSFTLEPQVDPKRFSLNKKDETMLASLLNYQVTELTTKSLPAPTNH